MFQEGAWCVEGKDEKFGVAWRKYIKENLMFSEAEKASRNLLSFILRSKLDHSLKV